VTVRIMDVQGQIEQLQSKYEKERSLLRAIYSYFHTSFAKHVFNKLEVDINVGQLDDNVLAADLKGVQQSAWLDPLTFGSSPEADREAEAKLAPEAELRLRERAVPVVAASSVLSQMLSSITMTAAHQLQASNPEYSKTGSSRIMAGLASRTPSRAPGSSVGTSDDVAYMASLEDRNIIAQSQQARPPGLPITPASKQQAGLNEQAPSSSAAAAISPRAANTGGDESNVATLGKKPLASSHIPDAATASGVRQPIKDESSEEKQQEKQDTATLGDKIKPAVGLTPSHPSNEELREESAGTRG
jgi:hypothetical protein